MEQMYLVPELNACNLQSNQVFVILRGPLQIALFHCIKLFHVPVGVAYLLTWGDEGDWPFGLLKSIYYVLLQSNVT